MDNPGQRVVVSETGNFDAELRTLSYAMINSFVAQHAIISEALAMRPAKMIVYLTIIASTVQKVMRAPNPSEAFRAGAKMPSDRLGYISRRALAAATGLPNENVRRIVIELIDEGLVMIGPSRGVRNTGGNFQNPRILAALRQLFAEHLRTSQIFLDADAIAVCR